MQCAGGRVPPTHHNFSLGQAALLGITSLELGRRYQALGLTGVALYEDNIESLVNKGYAAAMLGSEMRSQAAATLRMRSRARSGPSPGKRTS